MGYFFGWLRERAKLAVLAGIGDAAAEISNGEAPGEADAVAWGKLFIANPDLPQRFAQGAALNEPRPAEFYSGGAQGYTDYPIRATEPA